MPILKESKNVCRDIKVNSTLGTFKITRFGALAYESAVAELSLIASCLVIFLLKKGKKNHSTYKYVLGIS